MKKNYIQIFIKSSSQKKQLVLDSYNKSCYLTVSK